MLFTRRSMLTGITRTIDLPVTEAQLKDWQKGMLIQHAMPHLTDGQREFIISGATDEEWDEAFGEEE